MQLKLIYNIYKPTRKISCEFIITWQSRMFTLKKKKKPIIVGPFTIFNKKYGDHSIFEF